MSRSIQHAQRAHHTSSRAIMQTTLFRCLTRSPDHICEAAGVFQHTHVNDAGEVPPEHLFLWQPALQAPITEAEVQSLTSTMLHVVQHFDCIQPLLCLLQRIAGSSRGMRSGACLWYELQKLLQSLEHGMCLEACQGSWYRARLQRRRLVRILP